VSHVIFAGADQPTSRRHQGLARSAARAVSRSVRAENSAIAPSAFAVSCAARLGGGEPALQDLVLRLQGLDVGFEDVQKR